MKKLLTETIPERIDWVLWTHDDDEKTFPYAPYTSWSVDRVVFCFYTPIEAELDDLIIFTNGGGFPIKIVNRRRSTAKRFETNKSDYITATFNPRKALKKAITHKDFLILWNIILTEAGTYHIFQPDLTSVEMCFDFWSDLQLSTHAHFTCTRSLVNFIYPSLLDFFIQFKELIIAENIFTEYQKNKVNDKTTQSITNGQELVFPNIQHSNNTSLGFTLFGYKKIEKIYETKSKTESKTESKARLQPIISFKIYDKTKESLFSCSTFSLIRIEYTFHRYALDNIGPIDSFVSNHFLDNFKNCFKSNTKNPRKPFFKFLKQILRTHFRW